MRQNLGKEEEDVVRSAGAQALLIIVVTAAVATAEDPVIIRSTFAAGDQLRYVWHLEQENRWTPPIEGADWNSMSTEFDFNLVAEHVAADGACNFELRGQSLKSSARGPKGALGIDATPREAKLLIGEHWTKPGKKTPLSKPMYVTLGRRFNVTGSRGLEAIALYFLPSVDPRVWFALMTAPQNKIEPGQEWRHTFRFPIKELGNKPLSVALAFRTVEATTKRGLPAIRIHLLGELALANFDVNIKRERKIHIKHGRYSISGSALWELDRGVPVMVEAEQYIEATSASPESRFTHRALSRLALSEPDRTQ